MCDHYQRESADRSNSLPALLTIDVAVLLNKYQRIVKHMYRNFKGNTVLPKIQLRLVAVPFEMAHALPPRRLRIVSNRRGAFKKPAA
jgi:hypothetical protein